MRLTRVGSTKNPVYRIVVVDSRARRDGRAIETIGQYNPRMEPSLIEVDAEKAKKWLGEGAQPSRTVSSPSGHHSKRSRGERRRSRDVDDLPEYLARSPVDNHRGPSWRLTDTTVVLELRWRGDVGKVIGKQAASPRRGTAAPAVATQACIVRSSIS
jgi:ribosomal protein S16